jgi:hypothetical protein
MARTIWCRWPACLKPTVLKKPWQGEPDTCPECKQSAMWSSIPTGTERPTEDARLTVTFNDRRFLKALRILPPEDEDDGA